MSESKDSATKWYQPSTLITLGAMVFALGGAWASHLSLTSQMENLSDKVHYHQDVKNHPDNTNRVDIIQFRMQFLESELERQKTSTVEVAKTQQTILLKLDRLCRSMPNCIPSTNE